MDTYRVRLLCNGDKAVPYEVGGISATCPEAAGWRAKIQIAEYGWFPGCLTFDGRLSCLKVESVTLDNR